MVHVRTTWYVLVCLGPLGLSLIPRFFLQPSVGLLFWLSSAKYNKNLWVKGLSAYDVCVFAIFWCFFHVPLVCYCRFSPTPITAVRGVPPSRRHILKTIRQLKNVSSNFFFHFLSSMSDARVGAFFVFLVE